MNDRQPFIWTRSKYTGAYIAEDPASDGQVYRVIELPSGLFEASTEIINLGDQFKTLEAAQERCERHARRPKGAA